MLSSGDGYQLIITLLPTLAVVMVGGATGTSAAYISLGSENSPVPY